MLNIRSEHLTLVFTWLLITFSECHFYLLCASDLMSALHPFSRLVFLFFSLSKQLFNNFTWHNVNVFSIHEGRKWVPIIFHHRFLLSNVQNRICNFCIYNLWCIKAFWGELYKYLYFPSFHHLALSQYILQVISIFIINQWTQSLAPHSLTPANNQWR